MHWEAFFLGVGVATLVAVMAILVYYALDPRYESRKTKARLLEQQIVDQQICICYYTSEHQPRIHNSNCPVHTQDYRKKTA